MGRFHILRHGLPVLLVLAGLALVVVYGLGNRAAGRGGPAVSTPTGQGTAIPAVLPTATFLPPETAAATQTASATAGPTEPASATPGQTASLTPIPPTPTPTRTPSPTATRPAVATLTPLPPLLPSRTRTTLLPPEITPSVTPAAPGQPSPTPYLAGPFDPAIPYLARFGVASGTSDLRRAYEAGLPFGSCLNWQILTNPPLPAGLDYWQMVRVREEGLAAGWTWQAVGAAVLARPGSIWIVGNEPDVIWQDNVQPESYAHVYHDVYTFIKNLDATAQVAIAGVAQSTPLRRAYLERVLETYRANYGPMPVDIWTVHAFTLREEADSWGVGIPPGMSDELAVHYEIADHGNIAIFQQNLLDFREWMAAQGYGDRPLAVTEYGILLPNDYGFPAEVVADFMTQSFDFFLNTAGENGYEPDGNRLVQWWFWYSIYGEAEFQAGNLFDPPSGELTRLGNVFADYVNAHE